MFLSACSTNRYQPKNVKKHRRCGDCPRFTSTYVNSFNTVALNN